MSILRPLTRIRHSWPPVLLILALAGSCGLAVAQERPAVALEGAVANRNFVAPADFSVIDTEATVAQAAASGENLPLVVRTEPSVTETVVAEFNAAFRNTRTAYLDAMEAAFGARTIGSREINSSRFRSFRSEFQAGNPLFPVNLVLAQTWAKGYDGEATRERLALALRAAMADRLIGDVRPASTVFVAALASQDRIRSWSEASSHTRAVNRSEITSVEVAGQDLRQSLDVLDRGAGGFITGLLRPNVIEDPYLTGLLLRERLGDNVQLRSYRRGDVLVRDGATVDRLGALAVAQLERLGLEPMALVPEAPAPVSASPEKKPDSLTLDSTAGAPGPVHAPDGRRLLYLLSGSAAALLLAGVAVWQVRRHRQRDDSARWLDQPAVTPARNVREALIPHLARELKNRLVQALFAQRQELLHNEAAASQRVADLEERLAKLQPAIAEKIRGYENRIKVLEAELEEKDQETRDLIRAKLVLARKELDAEISRQHITWN